jgi:hypothetical protein
VGKSLNLSRLVLHRCTGDCTNSFEKGFLAFAAVSMNKIRLTQSSTGRTIALALIKLPLTINGITTDLEERLTYNQVTRHHGPNEVAAKRYDRSLSLFSQTLAG